MRREITFLGKIIRVDSGTVEAELSLEIPSAAPIINGRLHKIGQIGTFIKIPIGNLTLYGIVSSISNVPTKNEDGISLNQFGYRYLLIQLVGEKVGDSDFEKGVGTYPTINDEIHLITESDLFDIYGKKGEGAIEIGKHSSSENLSVYVDLHSFVLRHSAILGSTGSGKSNTTVGVLKSILGDFQGSRIVLVDPHGEYSSAFPDANIFKINDDTNPLHIPFWLMNFEELAYFLVGAKPTEEQRPEYRRLRDLVTEKKKLAFDKLKSGAVDRNKITADSPIPFNVRELWHEIFWWLNASFTATSVEQQSKTTACLVDNGNADNLVPPSFKEYAMGPAAPYKSKHFQEFYGYEKKLISRLKDSRFDFMFNPGKYKDHSSEKDLHNLLGDWIGGDKRLTILDLSGVPFEVLDITIGLITRFIYDSMFWGRKETYTGRNRPLLIAYEEAHTYLSKSDLNIYSKHAVERIFKEGRKFGVGAMVISQRPSEISDTVLAQVGTFVALRLTNSGDQSIVKASAPDNLISLIDLLPSLRIGEAIVIGESIKIPSRVRIKLNHPRPTSEDPVLVKRWKETYVPNSENYKKVVTSIREQKL